MSQPANRRLVTEAALTEAVSGLVTEGELADVLESIDDFSIEGQEPIVMKWVEDKGYKLGDVMNAFRLALVGIGKGPGMFDISAFLGKEETIKRLRKAIEVLG